MRIMGTGSRSMVLHKDRVTIYRNLEEEILRFAAKFPDLHLISGMAEGWDEAIAKVGMRNSIPYSVMIPNRGYGDYYWRRNSLIKVDRMSTFNQLVNAASEVTYVCNSIYVNGVHANFIRNQAMVDACDGALVYEATSNGTRDAVARLNRAGKSYRLAPFKEWEYCGCPWCDLDIQDWDCKCYFRGGCSPSCIFRDDDD